MKKEWIHATDVETGNTISVQVPKILLIGLPKKEPARTKRLAWLHDKFQVAPKISVGAPTTCSQPPCLDTKCNNNVSGKCDGTNCSDGMS